MRNPLLMFSLSAMLVFAVVKRFPLPSHGKKEKASIWWTNLALAVIIAGIILVAGWKTYLLVQLPVLLFGTSMGVWMFYVQHNYDGVYWERKENWSFYKAALAGSSFYQLPAVLQWFTGNIGYHHIHHLGSRIPNYKLEQCFKENPLFHVEPMTIASSFKTLRLRLWDEAKQKMVGWEASERI
jgi:omega-6 fatty acid desaturase (delta-12 desaturase)